MSYTHFEFFEALLRSPTADLARSQLSPQLLSPQKLVTRRLPPRGLPRAEVRVQANRLWWPCTLTAMEIEVQKLVVRGYALSMDGYSSASGQSLDNPFGKDGLAIMDWAAICSARCVGLGLTRNGKVGGAPIRRTTRRFLW